MQPSSPPEVHHVAVRLPPFWADKPTLWFAQAEAQFAVSHVTTELTKYSYVVSQLDSRYAAEVEDIITNPPAENRYEYLKAELIRRLSISEEQRVRQLISEEELGDRKPSQFLRHLRSLAGGATTQDKLLRQLWLRRLPPHVQAILAAQSELATDKIAELADKILEVSPNPAVTAVNAASVSTVSDVGDIYHRVEELTKQVAILARTINQQRFPRRTRTPSRERNSVQRDCSQKSVCWYHATFADGAKKCKPPCNYQGNGNSSQ